MENAGRSAFQFSHSWLLIYPDLPMTTLIPVLYTLDPWHECSEVERLTVNSLLYNARPVLTAAGSMTLHDRLLELMYKPKDDLDDSELLQAWLTTGRHFQDNPLLKEARKKAQWRASRDSHFSQGEDDENK